MSAPLCQQPVVVTVLACIGAGAVWMLLAGTYVYGRRKAIGWLTRKFAPPTPLPKVKWGGGNRAYWQAMKDKDGTA